MDCARSAQDGGGGIAIVYAGARGAWVRFESPSMKCSLHEADRLLHAELGKFMATKARSAVSGRYVKKSTAKKNPKTTVIERTKPKKKK